MIEKSKIRGMLQNNNPIQDDSAEAVKPPTDQAELGELLVIGHKPQVLLLEQLSSSRVSSNVDFISGMSLASRLGRG